MKELLLKGENIVKAFQQTKVLNGVDVNVYKEDFTVIMGSSGAGKSTLLYALSGMDELTEGSVFYKEREISHLKENHKAKLRAEEFGFIFQQTHLVSNLTLFENVAVAGFVSGKQKDAAKRAEELLKQMHVEEARKRLPAQVSGGEAQRAAIARAIIGEPGILFADEPTGALNRANTEEVLNLLTALHEQGQSIIMVTHDIKAAVRANRILYLEDGRILDELSLPKYKQEEEQMREQKVSKWLTDLHW